MNEEDPLSNDNSYLHRAGTSPSRIEDVLGEDWSCPDEPEPSPFWDRLAAAALWMGTMPTVLVLLYVGVLMAGLAYTACQMP